MYDTTYDYSKYEGFKNGVEDYLFDEGGRARTASLFREKILNSVKAKGMEPLYTLKERTYEGFPSAYQIYMNSVDEYDAAMRLVGSMKTWRKLCNSEWFMQGQDDLGHTGLAKWREDMRLRDESEMKAILMNKAREGSVSAANSIYKASNVPKTNKDETNNNKGRPKKTNDYDEDASRLKLIK